MKRRADRIDAKLGRGLVNGRQPALWLRQKSIDGQAIMHADGRDKATAASSSTSRPSVSTPRRFSQRIDAQGAKLPRRLLATWKRRYGGHPGVRYAATSMCLLASTLTTNELEPGFRRSRNCFVLGTQAGTRRQVERAGLNATGLWP